jgi:hypothetical protein
VNAANPQILPVIMCGGAGTRLWPLSVRAAPKPFHRFGAEHTMFQQTVKLKEIVKKAKGLDTGPKRKGLKPRRGFGAKH